MANICSNRVVFEGTPEAIQNVQVVFLSMKVKEEATGKGQIPFFLSSEEGYFFNLYQNEGEDGIFEYQTRWSPNTENLQIIAERFGLGFTHWYEEMGCLIYGVTVLRNGELTDTYLDDDDFNRYCYSEDDDAYYFEGEAYESNLEILETLLERKIAAGTKK